jgi:hypothetical protein
MKIILNPLKIKGLLAAVGAVLVLTSFLLLMNSPSIDGPRVTDKVGAYSINNMGNLTN